MGRIILRTLKDRKISIMIYTATAFLLVWMYVAMFPSIAKQADEFSRLMESYPEGFVKAFNIDELSFAHIENFLAVEHYSFMWPILVIFMLVGLAGSGIAGEIEKGTIEILLSRPVSRFRIFFARFLSGTIILTVFTLLTSYAIVPFGKLHDVAYTLPNYWSVTVIGWLFGMAVFSVALLISALVSEKSKANMLTGGVLIVMYILNLVAAIMDSLENLKYASFFHYFSYQEALADGIISGTNVLVFAGVIAVCTMLGAYRFMRRDVAVS